MTEEPLTVGGVPDRWEDSSNVLPANFLLIEHLGGRPRPVRKVFGPFKLDLDTIWATGASPWRSCSSSAIVMRRKRVERRARQSCNWPSRPASDAITKQVEGSIGPRGLAIVPLALTLFVFIFV